MKFWLGLFITPDYVTLNLPNGQTKLVDQSQVQVGGLAVDRQNVCVADPNNGALAQSVATDQSATVSQGGANLPFRINSSSATSGVIKGSAGRVCKVWCVDGTAENSITLKLYDDPNGNPNNLIWQGVVAAGVIMEFHALLANGLSYSVSGAPSANQDLLITYN